MARILIIIRRIRTPERISKECEPHGCELLPYACPFGIEGIRVEQCSGLESPSPEWIVGCWAFYLLCWLTAGCTVALHLLIWRKPHDR